MIAAEKEKERRELIGIPYNEKVKRALPANQVAITKKEEVGIPKEKDEVMWIHSKVQDQLKHTVARVKAKMRPDDDDTRWAFSSPPDKDSKFNPYSRPINARKDRDNQNNDAVLPREQIIVYKELSKMFAYCINGDILTLELLFKQLLIARDQDQKPEYKVLLSQILEWTLYADTLVLSTAKSTELIDKVSAFVVQQVEAEHSKGASDADQGVLDQLWRILIVGWHLFVRTSFQQFKLINLILSQSTSPEIYCPRQSVSVPVVQMSVEAASQSAKKLA